FHPFILTPKNRIYVLLLYTKKEDKSKWISKPIFSLFLYHYFNISILRRNSSLYCFRKCSFTMYATPLSLLERVSQFATAFTSCGAFPIATPKPAHLTKERSSIPEPIATTSLGLIPI